MILINYKINLILTGPENCVLMSGGINGQVPKFAITHTNIYVPAATLSIKHNIKLIEQLKSGFKRTINGNKYQWKIPIKRQN